MSLAWRTGAPAAEVLEHAIAQVNATLSYLRAEVGPRDTVAVGAAVADDAWVGCGDLLANPTWLEAIMRDTGQHLGTEDPVVSASLLVQNYAYRVVTHAVTALTFAGVLPDSAPSAMAVSFRLGRPAALAYLEPRVALLEPRALLEDPAGARDAVAALLNVLDVHLAPLVAAVRATTRVGARLLWGNVAASSAVAFRTAEGVLGPWVQPLGEAFLEASPAAMRGLGSYLALEREGRHGWFFERTTCCLYDRLAGKVRCGDCSRTPREQRRDAYWQSLAGN